MYRNTFASDVCGPLEALRWVLFRFPDTRLEKTENENITIEHTQAIKLFAACAIAGARQTRTVNQLN